MKTNLSRLPLIIAAITILSIANTNLSAQVTVGSNIASTKGALLDLKTRQISGKPVAGVDPNNYTAGLGGGGLLLPRVILEGTNSLKPLLTDAEATDSLKYLLTGLMVYNIATVTAEGNPIPSLYPSVYTWDGSQWKTSEANKVDILTITTQPKAFSFNELGRADSVKTLSVVTSGGVGDLKYQWYQISGSNVHVRVGDSLVHSNDKANGSQTASYRPVYRTAKGTTQNANNCGFYRFYCVVTDDAGQHVESNVAEVAVGCGAKNNVGEWISFMCFNLGADSLSIHEQINYPITFENDSANGQHPYIPHEEKVYGSLFQWGRIADGHEIRSENGTDLKASVTYDLDKLRSAIKSGNACTGITADANRPVNQVHIDSIAWYGKFIAGNNNWNPLSDQLILDQLWRTNRYIPNDPCAHYNTDGTYRAFWYTNSSGNAACTAANTNWRLPSPEEWGVIYKGGTISGTPNTATANSWFWNTSTRYPGNKKLEVNRTCGAEVRPDNATTTLFLPASGSRSSNGSIYYQGMYGFYWSSTVSSNIQAHAMRVRSDDVSPSYNNYRSFGFAIRCIKNT